MAKRFLRTALLLTQLAVSGCTTLSFAPPPVPFDGHAIYTSKDHATRCHANVDTAVSVTARNAQSAVNLIDNYAGAYGCAVQSASNGRQFFQIPSQLAALVGIAGAAFNGPRNLALGAGIGAATFNSGNAYWAPQNKAQVFDAALDAILCIRTTAVGIEPYDTNAEPPKQTSGNDIGVPVGWRYYDTISAALGQVDRIAGSRLRATGKFDPEGLVAQIKQLSEDIKQKEDASSETGTPMAVPSAGPTPAATPAPAGQNGADSRGGPNGPATEPPPAAPGAVKPVETPPGGTYLVNIPLMQSKMQLCVVRAKM